MSNPVINTQAILDHYRSYFMDVYCDICGEGNTYPLLARSLEERLSMAMRSSDPVIRQYGHGIANMTLPGKAAAEFLRSHLNDGFNCPEGSATKESIKMMYAEATKAHQEIRPIVEAAENARDASDLHDAWQRFRQIYFGRSDYLDRFIMGVGSQPTPEQRRMHLHPLNQARINEIYGYASALNVIASQTFVPALSGISRFKDDPASTGIIRSQIIMMKLLHGHILRIKEGVDESPSADRKPVLDKLSSFHNYWKFISNPLNWLTKLVSEMRKSIGDFVEVKLEDHSPNIAHENFHLVAEAIDRIIIAAVNNKNKVTFYWDPRKKALVAESKSFRALSKDVAFVQLTGKLNARWELKPGWRKLYEKFSHRAEIKDRLIIPLQTDGSISSAPPPPVEPSPVPSGGSNNAGGVSGSDQNTAGQMHNDGSVGMPYAPTQLQIMAPMAAPAQVATTATLGALNLVQPSVVKIGL